MKLEKEYRKLTIEYNIKENFHKCLFAYDYGNEHFVLLKDYTNNLSELRCGLDWQDVYNDLEFKECPEFSDLKKTGFYIIEFVAWGWKELDSGVRYGCGDSDLQIISIKEIEMILGTIN